MGKLMHKGQPISGAVDVAQSVYAKDKNGNDSNVQAELNSLNSSLANMKPVTLWHNESPALFPAQTISLDLVGYQFVEIYFRRTNTENILFYTKIPVGTAGNLFCVVASSIAARGTYSYERLATVSTTGITFATGFMGYTGQASTEYNNACVPIYIVGIK